LFSLKRRKRRGRERKREVESFSSFDPAFVLMGRDGDKLGRDLSWLWRGKISSTFSFAHFGAEVGEELAD